VECEVVALSLGGSKVRYLIHDQILQKSAPLYALVSEDQTISVPELDPALAHPLIHYLYAGTLEWESVDVKFGNATRLYFAAIQYELPGLAELAKEEIIRKGEELDILSILGIVKHIMSCTHLDDDAWYWQYLEDVVQSAMQEDPEPFKRPNFITKFAGNSRLLQIVWKVGMSGCTTGSVCTSSARELDSGAETPLVASMLTESELTTQDSLNQLPSPTEFVVCSPLTLKQADDLIEPQRLELNASMSSDQSNVANPEPEQPVSDTVDNDNTTNPPDNESPTSQSQAVQIVAVPIEKIKEPEHIRADSVVAEDAVAPVKLTQKQKKTKKQKKILERRKMLERREENPPAVV
jgi:hypothetical protein